jgi:hypothetical protein
VFGVEGFLYRQDACVRGKPGMACVLFWATVAKGHTVKGMLGMLCLLVLHDTRHHAEMVKAARGLADRG